jgi:hypothetical protein
VLLNYYARLWARVFQGGRISLTQRGPKEVLLEAHGLPMFDGRAFPIAYRCVIATGLGLFARKLYVRQQPAPKAQSSVVLVSWV